MTAFKESVIPAKAGIQRLFAPVIVKKIKTLDSGFRRNDEQER